MIELTTQQVLDKIEALFEEWPQLRNYVPSEGLDNCCQRDEVAERWGWQAAWVWGEIQDWRWLLGDE